MMPETEEQKVEAEDWCQYYYALYLPPNISCYEPVSVWSYPILGTNNSEISIAEFDENYPDGYDVKSFVAIEFYWRDKMKDILGAGSKGIVIIADNPCATNSFTYQIDGPVPTYLGVGDHHNVKYDRYVISSPLLNLNSYRIDNSTYTGIPVDDGECVYTFRIYPSDAMKSGTLIASPINVLNHQILTICIYSTNLGNFLFNSKRL
jgi:hypothetical protein